MKSYEVHEGRSSNLLIGSRKGEARPLIKLDPGSPDFQDPDDPSPMFWFWSQAGHWEPPEYHDSDNPLDNDIDISFDQVFRGIDLDLGGNPGAIGVKNPGAQGQAIENVSINAVGAFAGIGNVSGLGAGEYDVEIIGGKYGVYIDTTQRTLSQYNGKVSLIGFTFIEQEEAVIHIAGDQVNPIMFLGFHITNSQSIPVNSGNIYYQEGGLVFVDGVINIDGGTLFQNITDGLYLRNVYVKNADAIVDSWNIDDSNTWTWIKEYSHRSQNYKNLMDGNINTQEIRNKVEGYTYTESDLVRSLVEKHKWEEGTFPSFEDSNLLNVMDEGATGNGLEDDTDAIQQAIERGVSENLTVFLPKGTYRISRTLEMKANSRLIGASKTVTIIAPHGSWKPDAETVMLRTEDSANGEAVLADLLIGANFYDCGDKDVLDSYYHNKTGTTQHDQFRFSIIEWRVGRNSIIRDVIAGAVGEYVDEADWRNDYHRFKVNGNGGGRWFGALGRWRGAGDNSRGLLIENTDEPMYVYPINFAGDPPNYQIDIINSSNKFFYYPSFEGGKTIFSVINSRNIGIFASNKNNLPSYEANRAIIEVRDSDNIVAAVINTKNEPLANENHILEQRDGNTYVIAGTQVALYKQGDAEYTEINEHTEDQTPFGNGGALWPIFYGAVIEAENYDNGINSQSPSIGKTFDKYSYFDFDSGNNGGAYRNDDVDIEICAEGGYNVGWLEDGEFLEYTVNAMEGVYDIVFRVASHPDYNHGELTIKLNGVDLGSVDIINAYGWQTYEDITLSNVYLSGGDEQILRLEIIGGMFNINYLKFMEFGVSSQPAITATASSYQEPNMPENTVDGSFTERWSAEGHGEWIVYDLGEVKNVTGVDIAWHRGDERIAYFSIEASIDGLNWSAVPSVEESGGTTEEMESYVIDDVFARYIRITGYGNSNNDWNSILEIDINTAVP